MCRTDLASSASFLLADCISSACSDSPPDCAVPLLRLLRQQPPTRCFYSNAQYREPISLLISPWLCAGLPHSGPSDGSGALPRALQCWGTPAYDGCMCRSDMASTANSFLTICASKYCQGNTDDIASAVSPYTAYCNGAMNKAVTTPANGGGSAAPTAASMGAKNTGSSVKVTGEFLLFHSACSSLSFRQTRLFNSLESKTDLQVRKESSLPSLP